MMRKMHPALIIFSMIVVLSCLFMIEATYINTSYYRYTATCMCTEEQRYPVGIISGDVWSELQHYNINSIETNVTNVLTLQLETLESYNIFTKAVMLRQKGIDVLAVVVPEIDSVYLLPDFNVPVIFLQKIKNNLVLSSEDIVKASSTLFLFNKEIHYVLCTAVELIRKLEWTSSIVIYDNSTEAVLDRLTITLEKEGIMMTTFNIDVFLRYGTMYELLTKLHNELLGTAINIIVICRPKCVTSLLQQANTFDLTEENYRRTAFYLESRWLILSFSHSDYINVSWRMMRLLNVALLTPDIVMIQQQNVSVDMDISLSYFQTANILKTLMVSKDGPTMVSRNLSYEDGYSIQNQVYPNANYGFNGRKFIVTTIVFYPFVMRNITNGTISYYGYCMDLLEELASCLNFTYEVTETEDNQFGALLPNGSWTGIVGLLQRREVDLAVAPLIIEARREMVMDFTSPFYFDSMTILMRRPDDFKEKWRVFINPFHWIVIVCVCTSVPVIAFFIYILEKSKYPSHHSNTDPYSYQYALIYLFGALILQGGRMPMSRSSRILVSTWWIFSVVLASTYSGNLVAFLTVVKEKAPINTFDELVSQSEFKWGTLGGSIYETLFQNSTNPTFRRIWQGIEKTYPNDTDILHKDQEIHIDKVLEDKYAYLCDKTYFEIMMRNDCRYTVAEEEYPTIQYGVGLPEKSPLTWIFSEKISQMVEIGLNHQWVNKHWPNSANCKKAMRTEAKSVSLVEMQGAFYVTGAGLVVSFVIFCIEGILNYCRKYRSLSDKKPHCFCQIDANTST